MAQKRLKPAPAGTGLGWNSLAASNRDNNENLPTLQEKWLVARFGLEATRARLVAEIAWGRA